MINSHLLRCGKHVKLVLGSGPDEPQKVNPQLVDMIVRTRRWYEGLASGRYPTLRSIAVEERCDKSYVSRLLSVAFLAPDIVVRILIGDHTATLTPERLRKACPLPAGWDEQRAACLTESVANHTATARRASAGLLALCIRLCGSTSTMRAFSPHHSVDQNLGMQRFRLPKSGNWKELRAYCITETTEVL